jgi:hypothetical protein
MAAFTLATVCTELILAGRFASQTEVVGPLDLFGGDRGQLCLLRMRVSENAALLSRSHQARDRLDRAADAVADQVSHEQQEDGGARSRTLLRQAAALVGISPPRWCWFLLALELGCWTLQVFDSIRAANARSLFGDLGGNLQLSDMPRLVAAAQRGDLPQNPVGYVDHYICPPLAGVLAAATAIGLDGAAGAPPIRNLICIGRSGGCEAAARHLLWEHAFAEFRDQELPFLDLAGVTGFAATTSATLDELVGRRLYPPSWDHDRGTLSRRGVVVKEFAAPDRAPQQVAILDEFERLNWPDAIDAPAAQYGDTVLNDTIQALNRGVRGVKFRSADGYRKVRWVVTVDER